MLNTGKYLNFFRVKRKLIIRITLVSFILFFMLFSEYGFITSASLLWRIDNLKQEISKQKLINDSLNLRKKVLLTDSTEIERIAREHYGLIRKGEIVYIILKK